MRRLTVRVLAAAAAVLLAAGAVAGVVNREVLDGSKFAAHANSVRTDDKVSELVGAAITDQVIAFDENLVALRPAIEAVLVTLVRSSAFDGVVHAAVVELHDAFTMAGSGQVVLRLADLGAVVVAALKTVAPNVAADLPADLDVRLADVGAQTFAARVVHLTRRVSLLSWGLPLLGLLLLATALALSRRRQRTLAVGGLAIAVAGVLAGIVSGAAGVVAAGQHTGTLRGAVVEATWRTVGPQFWRAAAVLAVVGLVVFAAAGAYLPQWSVAALEERAIGWLRRPGAASSPQLVSGAVLVIAGGAALYRPLDAARVLVVFLALAALVEGVSRISRVSAESLAAERAEEETSEAAVPPAAVRPRRHWVGKAVAVVGVAALVGYVSASALPANRPVSAATPIPTSSSACNGYAALCSRRYDQVSFAATHNAMSAADEDGWFIPEQPTGLVGQLNAGVRVLLIDTWYGQHTERSGIIANSAADRQAALDQAQREYGAPVLDSALRLRSALHLTLRGAVAPYLCHALCELGSTPMLDSMIAVRQWMQAHPREVVTFIIEDSVSPADTATVFRNAGLLPFVHTEAAGQPWPTLGDMITSGRRLQVFMQRSGGGAAAPWLVKAFDWIQDTPYDNASAAALNCRRLRGAAGNSLLLINNILTRFATRVSDSARINAFGALYPYVTRCKTERGQLPNFIAVDYYNKGDVLAVVNRLNGVG